MCVKPSCCCSVSSGGGGLGPFGTLLAVVAGAYCLVVAYWDAIVAALIRLAIIAAVVIAVPLVGLAIGAIVVRYDLARRAIASVRAMVVRRRLRRRLAKAYELGPVSPPLALPASQPLEIPAQITPAQVKELS
jgi:hypothetical protein